MGANARRRETAFSLVELLAVTGILALIAAVLAPVFVRARVVAGREACVGRMRQVALGAAMYRDDNDGHYPNVERPAAHGVALSRQARWSHVTEFRVCLAPYVGGADAFTRLSRCPAVDAPYACFATVRGTDVRRSVFVVWDNRHAPSTVGFTGDENGVRPFRQPAP